MRGRVSICVALTITSPNGPLVIRVFSAARSPPFGEKDELPNK
jgi:hypothetical protein